MRVLKFGGTSLANAERFLKVVNIIEKAIKKEQISIVLSAPSKITNYLNDTIKEALYKKNIISFDKIKLIIHNLLKHISIQQNNFFYQHVKNNINVELLIINKLLKKISLLGQCNDKTKAAILCKGEIISILVMEGILKSKNYKITIINPIKELLSTGSYLNAEVNIEKSISNIQKIKIPKDNVILMAGFMAGSSKKKLKLLGRNGSDYSAAVLAVCLKANYCEIWTDVDGIYTCDPKIVANAYLIKQLNYQEALKLSYFGAKILHPKTINPILSYNIPCIIKNTFNPKSHGTIINNHTDDDFFIKGITFLDNIVLIKIESSIQNKNILKINSRACQIITINDIEIILITQSSSQKNVTLCIFKHNLKKVLFFLQQEFQSDLQKNYIKPFHIINNVSILSIVSTNLHKNKFITSKILNALCQLKINIYAIAQEYHEENLSIVIKKDNITQAIKIIHSIIFNNFQTIELFLIGVGSIGSTLLKQINEQKKLLKSHHVQIKVCGIANSTLLLTDLNGICLNEWFSLLKKTEKSFNTSEKILHFIKNNTLVNPVIVDCTSSLSIALKYSKFISNGCHVVTPNKKANTTSINYYKEIRQMALKYKKKFLYETNIGAGLPIIENLQKLIISGDTLFKFKGILSGSLSFIFGKLDEDITFSQAMLEAQKLGFTEPDPKDDLSGIDVARKLLILAREVGFETNLEDIEIESILPDDLRKTINTSNFIQQLSTVDKIFQDRVKIAKKSGKVLRFIGTIENKGKCQIKIEYIDKNDPLYSVKNGENALIFYSQYYSPIPLVIRGYGAGNKVTAAGVFSDILRVI